MRVLETWEEGVTACGRSKLRVRTEKFRLTVPVRPGQPRPEPGDVLETLTRDSYRLATGPHAGEVYTWD